MLSRSSGVSTACSSLSRSASMRLRMVALERSDSTRLPLSISPSKAIERRRAVARMGQRAGVVARLVPPALGVGDERRQKPHQGPPFLHGAPEIVHGLLVGTLRVDHRGAGLGQDIGRNGAHNRSDRRFRLQSWFLAHDRF